MAKFLCKFKIIEESNQKINTYASDRELIKMSKSKIKGMGYALACSFLKDSIKNERIGHSERFLRVFVRIFTACAVGKIE